MTRNLTVEYQGKGIHYVIGDIYPIQILEIKRLSDDNIFLKNLRRNLTSVEMKKTLHALEDAGVTDKRDVYLSCIIDTNWEIFKEVVRMIPDFKERFMEAGEEEGWFIERDKKRDIEKAKKSISRGYSAEDVAAIMDIPLALLELETLV